MCYEMNNHLKRSIEQCEICAKSGQIERINFTEDYKDHASQAAAADSCSSAVIETENHLRFVTGCHIRVNV